MQRWEERAIILYAVVYSQFLIKLNKPSCEAFS